MGFGHSILLLEKRIIEELNGAARKVCGQLSFVASIVFSCIGTQMLKVLLPSKFFLALLSIFIIFIYTVRFIKC